MTRFEQIQAAFPEHWRIILQRMCPRMRNMYLVEKAYPSGASDALRGAFDWQRTSEGYAFWWKLARKAEAVDA